VTAAALIGPNAITRTLEALRERIGERSTGDVLRRAGLERYGVEPPDDMVPEDEVVALYGALRAQLGASEGTAAVRLAGRKTADYLLAHRIPAPVRVLLKLLPPPRAAPLLTAAILRHTWTFAGSASVVALRGRPLRIALTGCPICRGAAAETEAACGYYAATFETLFRALVAARARVVEIACEAAGDPSCIFEVRY
jgi:divinyl protochlorophyllide a 8-vinyl-reductase